MHIAGQCSGTTNFFSSAKTNTCSSPNFFLVLIFVANSRTAFVGGHTSTGKKLASPSLARLAPTSTWISSTLGFPRALSNAHCRRSSSPFWPVLPVQTESQQKDTRGNNGSTVMRDGCNASCANVLCCCYLHCLLYERLLASGCCPRQVRGIGVAQLGHSLYETAVLPTYAGRVMLPGTMLSFSASS